ncbi:MAG: hypothetical protein WDN69_26140 [Aliidongia sp.]
MLNYDILGTFTGLQNTGGGLLDFRMFSPYGLLQSTALANIAPTTGQKNIVRLDKHLHLFRTRRSAPMARRRRGDGCRVV